jgi:hypothetical protein
MNWSWWYTMWTTGTFTVTLTLPLDWRLNYLVTGGLTQTDSGDYAHLYIAEVCTYNGSDVVLCGLRDLDGETDLNIVEPLSSADRVTIKLRTTGGRHRAEGVVYQV